MSNDFEDRLIKLGLKDASALVEAGKAYGDSWKKRGGAGAFMVLARKWDRIENQCEQVGYDIFQGHSKFHGMDGLIDDIRDLRRYLLLVEEHLMATGQIPDITVESFNQSLQEEIDEASTATRSYVDQD